MNLKIKGYLEENLKEGNGLIIIIPNSSSETYGHKLLDSYLVDFFLSLPLDLRINIFFDSFASDPLGDFNSVLNLLFLPRKIADAEGIKEKSYVQIWNKKFYVISLDDLRKDVQVLKENNAIKKLFTYLSIDELNKISPSIIENDEKFVRCAQIYSIMKEISSKPIEDLATQLFYLHDLIEYPNVNMLK